MEPMGKIAYEAWRESIQKALNEGRTPEWVNGDESAKADLEAGLGHEWEDLEAAERDGWEAAAQAVVAHSHPPADARTLEKIRQLKRPVSE